MSWQATAWAEKQVTGSPARKVLLLVLANYADEDGICWPSQETLAKGTEQSLDQPATEPQPARITEPQPARRPSRKLCGMNLQ
jgi:hypothetical protein